uniref:Uncharacterized protein n=1 Tax=Panagrolaimus davidi TaxID=227884 RepID=A0A914PDY5_9BILA
MLPQIKTLPNTLNGILKKKADKIPVIDVLKIMSMPADQIKDEVDKNDKWKFTITNDSNNPVLIEFDNFNGKKNAQSPQFFMAMLLKEHNRAITNKLGEKPKELGFCLFDEFTDDERKRVEDGLTEACKLLKQECRFISLK